MNLNGSKLFQKLRLALVNQKPNPGIQVNQITEVLDKEFLKHNNEDWEDFKKQFEDITSTIVGDGGVNIGDMRAIFAIVGNLGPKRVLEVGTHLGFSTSVIAKALELNGHKDSTITSVDISDVNNPDAKAWLKSGSQASPKDICRLTAPNIKIEFVTESSVNYFNNSDADFDFVFLDGSHDADTVYKELIALGRVLRENSFVLLHDYFPAGKPLWSNNNVIFGPYLACERLLKESSSPLKAQSLSPLPWGTKLGSQNTSLAYIARR